MMLQANQAHAAPMAAIHQASFAADQAWGAPAIAALLAAPGIGGLISAQGGFILWRRALDEADVVTIAVLPEARRLGLGRALLRTAMAALAGQGVMHLFLEVAEANAAALGLYRAESFAEIGRRPGYYANGDAALLMRRELEG